MKVTPGVRFRDDNRRVWVVDSLIPRDGIHYDCNLALCSPMFTPPEPSHDTWSAVTALFKVGWIEQTMQDPPYHKKDCPQNLTWDTSSCSCGVLD